MHTGLLSLVRQRLRRVEARWLIICLAAASILWVFLTVAGEMVEGETEAFDRRLLLMLRTPGLPSDPIGPRWLEEAIRDVTALGGFTVLTLITAVGVGLLLIRGRRRQALILGVTVIAAQMSSELLKALYDRARPDLVPHGSVVYSQSFPSGHSVLAAATYLTLAAMFASLEPTRRGKALVYGAAVLTVLAVGFSRIYLGVHWPTDVLGGWALGSAWALAAWLALGGSRAGVTRPLWQGR